MAAVITILILFIAFVVISLSFIAVPMLLLGAVFFVTYRILEEENNSSL
jgi:hypothetical protein